MALVKCEECSKEYSSTLAACPHCGYIKNMRQQQIAAGQILQDRQDRRKSQSSCIMAIFLFLVIGVIVFIVGMVACNSVIMPQSADLIKGRILSESANL